MYDLYVMYLSQNIKQLEKKVIEQTELIHKQLKNLNEYKPFIENYLDYNALLNGKLNELPKEHKNNIIHYALADIAARNYYFTFNTLKNYEKKIKEYKVQKISYTIYRKILSLYNKKVLNHCVETGDTFTNKYFGTLQIKYKTPERVSKRVNWKNSKKNLAEINARGGIPYLQKEADKAKEEGREYKGEKWIDCGFEDGLLYYHWDASVLTISELKKETYNYKYVPARGKFGAVSILSAPYSISNYDYTKYAT